MSDNSKQTSTNKPALYIYAKVKDGDDTRIASRIGVAFHHKDGIGLNILLDAQPIPQDGRLELVALAPKEKS